MKPARGTAVDTDLCTWLAARHDRQTGTEFLQFETESTRHSRTSLVGEYRPAITTNHPIFNSDKRFIGRTYGNDESGGKTGTGTDDGGADFQTWRGVRDRRTRDSRTRRKTTSYQSASLRCVPQ